MSDIDTTNTAQNPFSFLNFFDAIYCINLEERKDRWVHAKEQFKILGIEKKVQRIDAIKREAGWMGARDSHVAAIFMAKHYNHKNILVLEDDFKVLVPDLKYYEKLFEDVSNKAKDWHLLFLSANTHQPLRKYSDYLFSAELCMGLHSIAYNSTIFDRILKDYYDEKIGIIDVYYMNTIEQLGRSFVANKLCTTQIDDYSDVEGKVTDRKFIEERFKLFTGIEIKEIKSDKEKEEKDAGQDI